MENAGNEPVIYTDRRLPVTKSLTSSQKMRMLQLLDDWEEPETERAKPVSIGVWRVCGRVMFLEADFACHQNAH
jgi:hypothetical protein